MRQCNHRTGATGKNFRACCCCFCVQAARNSRLCSAMAGFHPSYFANLVGPARARYKSKIEMREGVDPYELRIGKDAVADAELLPSTVYPNIYNYLVLATSYATQEDMRMFKSLEAHNFTTSGFVKCLAATQLPSKRVIVFSEVRTRKMRAFFVLA